jgi:hypothetical protein
MESIQITLAPNFLQRRCAECSYQMTGQDGALTAAVDLLLCGSDEFGFWVGEGIFPMKEGF